VSNNSIPVTGEILNEKKPRNSSREVKAETFGHALFSDTGGIVSPGSRGTRVLRKMAALA
jgi:hypothetical protein